jgi:hypothetical protein
MGRLGGAFACVYDDAGDAVVESGYGCLVDGGWVV